MTHVEIYKLKKTVDPEVREHGMSEFSGMGGPFPKNYVREFSGELSHGMLSDILGRSHVDPPDGYRGGPLEKGDVVLVDGQTFFLDREAEVYRFAEVDFDTSNIKDAVHVDYGRHVPIEGAEQIPRTFAIVCESLDIPVGYESAPGYHGSDKGIASFERSTKDKSAPCYLHPQFLKGEDAKGFVSLLKELSETDRWGQIAGFLRENYPVSMEDLEAARIEFAPELLLPTELRPLANHIPIGADKAELAYLAAKVSGLDEGQKKVFDAAVETGWHCGSVAEIINITENLDCFDLQPVFLESGYGDYRLERDWDGCRALLQRLERSGDPAEQALVKFVTRLYHHADEEAYGYNAAKEDGGVFIKQGLITQIRELKDVYRGVQDIPTEYGAQVPALPEQAPPKPIMVKGADLPSLLLAMHAVGGGHMRDAQYNIRTLASKGDDFFIRMHPEMLVVTPADSVFRRDMTEYETWMLLNDSPDIRTFVMSVTNRDDGKITGNLFEAGLYSIQGYVREHSFFFTHLDAEMKDGTSRRFTIEEWDAMDMNERGQLASWKKHYNPADEAALTTYFGVLRWAVEENRRPVEAGDFLSRINGAYMSQAGNPQPGMIRVAPEAAQEILAQGAAEVFRLMPNGMERLSPIDAIKVPAYQSFREFAVKPDDLAGIEKWAQRASGDMLRQMGRGERDKSKRNGEEL